MVDYRIFLNVFLSMEGPSEKATFGVFNLARDLNGTAQSRGPGPGLGAPILRAVPDVKG